MIEKSVLVVEDNELNMKLMRSLLVLGKYQVLEATDAETGIAKASEKRPDLILMDIQLPGMDGLSATSIVKKDPALKNIPIIAVTSHAMQGDDQKAIDAGCEGYISKPIDTRKFLEQIAQFIEKDSDKREVVREVSRGHKSTILIVDDDPLNVKLLAATLPTNEYKTITAYGGIEALEKVNSQSPDLILLDIMMPEIDGYEVTRRVKSEPHSRKTPIILITALDGTTEKIKGIEAGADEFLNKPVNAIELSARVKSLLRLKQYREQLKIRSQSREAFTLPSSKEETTQTKDLPVVLLVEDNETDAKLIQKYLEGQQYLVKHVSDGEETISYAQGERVDLVLLDILLPRMDGFEVCKRLKEMYQMRNTQIVLITCLSDMESKIKGIDLGADDYLVKPINKEELKARVNALLKKKACIDKLSTNYESALHSAITDSLTGVYNHSYFKHFLELETKRSLRQGNTLALIMIDIDGFKEYNDTLGHLAGDQVLRELADLLKSNIREVDLAARYGGDEFALVFPYTNMEKAQNTAERITRIIHEHLFDHDLSLPNQRLSVSMGMALFPEHSSDISELIKKADRSLYRAKEQGGNRVCVCKI